MFSNTRLSSRELSTNTDPAMLSKTPESARSESIAGRKLPSSIQSNPSIEEVLLGPTNISVPSGPIRVHGSGKLPPSGGLVGVWVDTAPSAQWICDQSSLSTPLCVVRKEICSDTTAAVSSGACARTGST